MNTFLLWLAGTFIVIVLSILILGFALSSPSYKGPESANFNGQTFINGEGYEEKGFGQLLKWMTSREPGEWTEKSLDDLPYGPAPADSISDSTQVITYVNHSTFLIQTNGINILTDPVWSDRVSPFSFAGPKRMRPPGINFDDLPEIDVILISHNHYDHLDISTLKKITQKFDPLIITPLGVDLYLNKKGLSNTLALDWWQQTSISEDLQIAAVEAQHFSSRGMFDRDKTLWAGFVVLSDRGNIYFAGDTGYNSFFKKIGEEYAPIKTALIPIGAYIPRWFMSPVHVDPAQALQIHRDLDAEMSIGMHFGTFPLADDGEDDPLNDLKRSRQEENFITIPEGSSIVLD